MAWAIAISATAHSGVGDLRASTEVRAAIETSKALGTWVWSPCWYGFLAQTQINEGDYESALESVTEGKLIATRTGESWYNAELHRLHGDILLRHIETNGADMARTARAEYDNGIAIARRQQARTFELRCTVRLVKSRVAGADKSEIRANLQKSFAHGSATARLVQICWRHAG